MRDFIWLVLVAVLLLVVVAQSARESRVVYDDRLLPPPDAGLYLMSPVVVERELPTPVIGGFKVTGFERQEAFPGGSC